MIKKENGKFCVYSADGKKKLGEYATKPEAEKRLAQIKQFKKDGSICETCDGEGIISDDQAAAESGLSIGSECPDCGGDGYLADHSTVKMFDSFLIDGVRKVGDGYLAAFAKTARTGIQVYKGSELGRPDLGEVRVYRSEKEVFSADAMRSFAHRPITLKHPREGVSARTWKKYAGGQTGEDVVRDGEFVKVPMLMMDQSLIDAVESGTRELSWGYSADIKWRQGVTDSGEKYDAVQTAIRANHLAVVPVARGGKELRVGDGKSNHKEKSKMKLTIDGVPVEVEDDVAGSVIQRQLTKDAATIADLTAKLNASAAEVKSVKDANEKALADQKKLLDENIGKVVVLEKAVKDAEWTPEKLQAHVKDRADIISKATPFLAKDYKYETKDVKDIKKDAVTAHLGDGAKSLTDDQVTGAFMSMTKDIKPGTGPLADAIRNNQSYSAAPRDVVDKAHDDMTKRLENQWKPATAAA